jgi:hypothetical protein
MLCPVCHKPMSAERVRQKRKTCGAVCGKQKRSAALGRLVQRETYPMERRNEVTR